MQTVVSTVISGILFARFPTVECVPTVYSFLVTSLTVEARNERESRLFAPLINEINNARARREVVSNPGPPKD